MPVLIQELVITTLIDANTGNLAKPITMTEKTAETMEQKELVRHCVEQVLAILHEKQER